MEEKKKVTVGTVMTVIVGVLFSFWMVMGAFPTGWLYDLGVGTGTQQGQRPGSEVRAIERKEDAREFFSGQIPATVTGEVFVQCPLMRLRDSDEEGLHRSWNHISRTKRGVEITEYYELDYPITPLQKVITFFSGAASYNPYYLVQLEDGSYLCAFFDDYHMLQNIMGGEVELPTGYVRGSTGDEYQMLYEMAKDYDVDPTLVLDMYRDGKGPWMLDKGLRLVLAVAIVMGAVVGARKLKSKLKNRR